jgi:hypothetical protein
MNYSHLGTAYGREVFGPGEPGEQNDGIAPAGYSIAGVVLKDGWKSDELGWLLNELYGSLQDWTEFDPNGGARSFVFFGERSEEATNLCDTFAYAWTKGSEESYDSVVASWSDAADVEAFVESMFSGEIAIGDAYTGKLQNTILAVAVSDPPSDDDTQLMQRVGDAAKSAVQRHRFD